MAGVVLFNSSGTNDLVRVGAVQNIAPNTEAEYTLDLKNVNGTRFLLQVYDYAMNKTTYVIDQTIGDPTALPDMIAYNLHQRFWVALNTTSTREDLGTAYAETPHHHRCHHGGSLCVCLYRCQRAVRHAGQQSHRRHADRLAKRAPE